MKISLIVLLATTLAGAPDVPDPQLTYARPDDANAPLDQYQISEWAAGTKLTVAPLKVNLRDKPDTKGAVLAKLSMGDSVETVGEPGPRVKEDGLVNRWYKVKAGGKEGHVFGAFLTPFAVTADFDGDKQPETATVSFNSGMKILVRVKDGEDTVSEVELTPAGEGFLSRKGGVVSSAKLLPPEKMGTPLVEIGSHIEACGDYWDAYVSYTGGKAREALKLTGVSDPPVSQVQEVKFSPGLAEVEETVVEPDDKGKENKTVTRSKLPFKDGVFQKQDK